MADVFAAIGGSGRAPALPGELMAGAVWVSLAAWSSGS